MKKSRTFWSQFRAFARNEVENFQPWWTNSLLFCQFSQYRPVGKMGIREATPLLGPKWLLGTSCTTFSRLHYTSFMPNACLYVILWWWSVFLFSYSFLQVFYACTDNQQMKYVTPFKIRPLESSDRGVRKLEVPKKSTIILGVQKIKDPKLFQNPSKMLWIFEILIPKKSVRNFKGANWSMVSDK